MPIWYPLRKTSLRKPEGEKRSRISPITPPNRPPAKMKKISNQGVLFKRAIAEKTIFFSFYCQVISRPPEKGGIFHYIVDMLLIRGYLKFS